MAAFWEWFQGPDYWKTKGATESGQYLDPAYLAAKRQARQRIGRNVAVRRRQLGGQGITGEDLARAMTPYQLSAQSQYTDLDLAEAQRQQAKLEKYRTEAMDFWKGLGSGMLGMGMGKLFYPKSDTGDTDDWWSDSPQAMARRSSQRWRSGRGSERRY